MEKICSTTVKLPQLSDVTYRVLEKGDYKKGFTELLAELTECKMTEDQFNEVFDEMVC